MSDVAILAPKCGAKRSTRGPSGEVQYCKMPAGYGTTHPGYGHCRHHYGNTTTGRQHGARLMIKDLARKAVEDRGIDPDNIDPYRVMMEELARSYAIVLYLEDQTDEAAALWPDWHKVLLAERKHSVDVAKMMISAGIEERQVRVMEAQAQILGGAVRLILDRMDLTPEQKLRAPIVVREVMSSLPAA